MITKNFIKQCEQAEEIQKFCQYKMGDWFLFPEGLFVLNCDMPKGGRIKFPWLPTQEQLQEMSGIPWWRFDKRCDGVRCCLLEDPLNNIEIRTKEEAGICVVMEKKYNKIWTGEKWEEVKTSE